MTYARREEILSKEIITIPELGELLWGKTDCYQMAAKVMRQIKRKHDRLGIKGQLHVQDYIDEFGLPSDRYTRPLGDSTKVGDDKPC